MLPFMWMSLHLPTTRSKLSPIRALLFIVGLAPCWACAPRPLPPTGAPSERVAVVVAERGEHGIHLVGLDEAGDRQFELVRAAPELARDLEPTISPDGRWIVFASSRGREFSETSLWIARTEPDAVAAPLTHGTSIESHAAWRPDGGGIVFDSTRAHGEFDVVAVLHDPRASRFLVLRESRGGGGAR